MFSRVIFFELYLLLHTSIYMEIDETFEQTLPPNKALC